MSVIQQELQDDAGGNRNQNIVAACLNPMVTTGRSTQIAAAPVIDHKMPVAIFDRKAIAHVEFMVWACATFFLSLIDVRADREIMAIRLAPFIAATLLLAAVLFRHIATATVAVPITLGEGKFSRGIDHAGLHLVGKCPTRLAHLVAHFVPT